MKIKLFKKLAAFLSAGIIGSKDIQSLSNLECIITFSSLLLTFGLLEIIISS